MDNIYILAKIFVMGILMILAFIDIRKKEIPNLLFLIAAIPVGIFFIIDHQGGILDHISGMFVGIILLIISKVTRGKIGIGDGLTFCIIGLSVGLLVNIQILMLALFASAVYAILLIAIKHVEKNHTMPFIPFILIGYIGVVMF